MSQLIYCPNCGTAGDAKFCPNCGTNLDDVRKKMAEKNDTKPENSVSQPQLKQPVEKPQPPKTASQINTNTTTHLQKDTISAVHPVSTEPRKQSASVNSVGKSPSIKMDKKASNSQPIIPISPTEPHKQSVGNEQSKSTKKSPINFVLIVLMFISIICAYISCAMRYFITPYSVSQGFDDNIFSEAIARDSEGNTVSFSQEVLNLMGEHFTEDLEITEEKLKKFLSDYEVEKSFADLYYSYIMQFVDINRTGLLTSEQFTDIFRNNPEEVKEHLGVEFNADDYELMNEVFAYGFFTNLSTTDVIAAKYPIQFTNALFSEYTIWFGLSLLALSICLYILINNDLKVSAFLKLLYKVTVAAAIAMSLLWAYYKFIQHSIIADSLMVAFVITIIVASIPIGVARIRRLFGGIERSAEENDKAFKEECARVFGEDEEGDAQYEEQ